MYAFGWTELGYFNDKEDELVLMHAMARYHAFLDLMSSSLMSFFVPMLDIDLVWHSHQLMGSRYANECARYCDAERVRTGRMDANAFEHRRAHDMAFPMPMPFYHPITVCVIIANPDLLVCAGSRHMNGQALFVVSRCSDLLVLPCFSTSV
ncbi:hypothetical protein SCP_0300190 [Sparassis crispa]|uniref:Uncharacterized protein n=1 Tax=Sparassis crispa TaxID=139825 RepID=A0A401GDP3_9APHY|nr:hypothetical protein SCP_0300190 [Sparassis crispa]GBE80304.1 hypothetical protein SCP_0300190 [Sparassis crispa]